MSFVRVRCKMPPPPPRGPLGIEIRMLPSLPDCSIVFVDDEGREHELTTVRSVSFHVREGEAATLVLEVSELEVELEADDYRLFVDAPAPEDETP